MNIFEEIYKNNIWVFGSGHGSLPSVTKGYRNFVQNFIKINNIKSVVDYGCGDWQFSRLMNWQGIEYLGLEVVPALVKKNTKLYGKKNIKFILSPSSPSKMPKAELLLVKDVLQHFSGKEIKKFIDKVLPLYRFSLITNGVIPSGSINYSIKTGEFRPLDLRLPPFNLNAAAVYVFGRKRTTLSIRKWKLYDPWQETVLLIQNKHTYILYKKMKLYRTTFNKDQILYYQADDKSLGINVFQTRQYDEYECSLVLKQLRKGDIALDVGANIGCYTLIMAKAVGPSGHVYSFEPDPNNFQILLKNIRANRLTNVTALNMAVSEKQEDQQLYLSTNNYGDHRLYEDKSEKRRRKAVPVKSNSLDNLIFNQLKINQKIKLIKIDTQGYEPFIIRGARQLISMQKPVLFFEYWTYGYKIMGVDFHQMIHFLKNIYSEILFIDQKYGVYYPINQDFIDRYCEQQDGQMPCDLMCGATFPKSFFHTICKLPSLVYSNRFSKILKISFGIKGNSFLYRKKGWSHSEGDFTWTNNQKASLQIDLRGICSRLHIDFTVFPLLVPGKKDNQKLILDINGHRVKSWVLVAPGDQCLSCDIPEKMLNRSDLRLTFETPDAVSPKAMGISGDNRNLAVAFKNMVVTRGS